MQALLLAFAGGSMAFAGRWWTIEIDGIYCGYLDYVDAWIMQRSERDSGCTLAGSGIQRHCQPNLRNRPHLRRSDGNFIVSV